MLNDAAPVEIITGRERRRRYSAEQKLALVDETMQPGMTVSAVARLRGVFASLLFKWRQLVPKGGQVIVICARELELRVRELDRLLGRKTMEIEVKEALTATREKVRLAVAVAMTGWFPVKDVAEILGMTRPSWSSSSQERLNVAAAAGVKGTTSFWQPSIRSSMPGLPRYYCLVGKYGRHRR